MSDSPRDFRELPAGADIRLIACDMDGTLLLPDGTIPARLWPLLDRLAARGVTFVPASGRQFATLAGMFPGRSDSLSFIAENGNLVVHRGEVLLSDSLPFPVVADVLGRVRASDRNLGLVVCGRDSAWIEDGGAAFVAEARKYYASLEVVPDLGVPRGDVLKLAIFDREDSAITADTLLADLADSQQVVVSGRHWVDIMNPCADKGRALRALQDALGVSREQTAAFGDYLNDLELLQSAGWSFAMANAHPDIRAAAAWSAPANSEQGVIQVLESLLG